MHAKHIMAGGAGHPPVPPSLADSLDQLAAIAEHARALGHRRGDRELLALAGDMGLSIMALHAIGEQFAELASVPTTAAGVA